MGFSLSKIFKPKPTIDTSVILNQIDYKEGTKYAENESAKIYIDVEELGGFPYLKTVLFGIHNINVKRTGCTISFKFNEEEVTLSSDNTTIESDQIQKTGVFHTAIDFELNEQEAKKIESKKAIEVQFSFKNTTINLTPV